MGNKDPISQLLPQVGTFISALNQTKIAIFRPNYPISMCKPIVQWTFHSVCVTSMGRLSESPDWDLF